MKLVMTLLVRDEEDIVAANIDFHLAQGVDFVIAMDNLSVDRTTALLQDYARRGLLHYILQKEDDYSQGRWVTSMARLAFTAFQADWVINNDADEFWYPEEGNLKQVLDAIPSQYDAAAVARTNFIARPMSQADFFADIMTMRERNSLNPLGKPLPGKLCHRGFPDIEIEQGNHAISRPAQEIAVTDAPITIFHFPMRTYPQFANKIALGGAAYARNTELPHTTGETWRRLYEIWSRGDLEKYYQAAITSDEDILDSRLVFDDRLKVSLANLRKSSISNG
jgi:hypothetical protein